MKYDILKVILSIITGMVPIFNLCPYKIKLKQNVFKIIIGFIILCFSFAIYQYLMTLLLAIFIFVFISKSYKNKFLAITLSILDILIVLISDYTISNIFIFVLNINISEFFAQNYYNYYIYVFFTITVALFISKIIGYVLNEKIKIVDIKATKLQMVLIIMLLVLTIVILYFNTIIGNNDGLVNKVIATNGIMVTLFFIILIIVVFSLLRSANKELEMKYKESEIEHQKELLKNLQEYTGEIEALYNNMRIFRHDYINIISSMSEYIFDKNYEELEKYFKQRIIPIGAEMNNNNYKLGLLYNLKIPEIKGIIAIKAIKAQENNIDFLIDIAEEISYINIDIIDLSKIFGIILDNAIEELIENEEAIEYENSYIKCAIINKDNSIIILVINSCKHCIKNISEIYEFGFSSKGENRGLGLFTLKKIINKYPNVCLDTIIDNDEFTINIEVCNKQ